MGTISCYKGPKREKRWENARKHGISEYKVTEKKKEKKRKIVTRDMKTCGGGCLTKEGHSKLVRTTLVWLGNEKIEKYTEKN